ncbi:MAG: DUF6538 domain-containing protein [Caldimonas sp.]
MVDVQLLLRIVHQQLELHQPPAAHPENSAADRSLCQPEEPGDATLTEALNADRSSAAERWTPRTNATYLTQAANGTWYLRLLVPAHLRAIHPELPKELRRSTKTCERRLALARARKLSIDFFIRFSFRKPEMLTPDNASPESFAILYQDGALQIKTAPQASPGTLRLMARCVSRMTEQIVARGMRVDAGAPLAGDTGFQEDQRGQEHPFPIFSEGSNGARQPLQLLSAESHNAIASAIQPDVQKVIWLSEAIEEWRLKSGVSFSEGSWEYSYKSTFRVFVELVGELRRDRANADGSIACGVLDIDVRQLGRVHIQKLDEGLKSLPPRQGKREDGMEAAERIADGKARKARPPSKSSVAKKLSHIRPFLVYAERKGWTKADVMQEMRLVVMAADSAVSKLQKGCIALSAEELKGMFEQPLFSGGVAEAPWKYWTPLLDLFQGFRVAESSGLYTNDILEVDGVPCLSVISDSHGDPTEDDKSAVKAGSARHTITARTADEYRRLKNAASRRVVPIHPELIRLGFLNFVGDMRALGPEPRHLFPQLPWEEKSMFGRKPSEHMRNLLKVAGIHQKRRKVPHSLRSNFHQALDKTLLTEDLQKRLLGHSTGAIKIANYNETDQGPAFPAAEVLPFLARVQFAIAVPSWLEAVGTEVKGLKE